MFHCAPLIRQSASEVDFIERKRHTGNDVVLVLFIDHDVALPAVDPAAFLSHFNHIFVAVQPVRKGDQVWYRYGYTHLEAQHRRAHAHTYPHTQAHAPSNGANNLKANYTYIHTRIARRLFF